MTDKAITDSAKDQICTIRLPNVCNFDAATTVFCHYNSVRLGSGKGIKSLFGAFGCSSCHSAIDGHVKTSYTRDELRLAHADGVLETMRIILRDMPHLWERFLND